MLSQAYTASERGNRHVLTANLAHIRSAVPEIFDALNKMKKNEMKKMKKSDGAKNNKPALNCKNCS